MNSNIQNYRNISHACFWHWRLISFNHKTHRMKTWVWSQVSHFNKPQQKDLF